MKKIKTTLLFLFMTTSLFSASVNDALRPLENPNADKWYLESWQKGYSYEQIASYEIDCTVKLDYEQLKEEALSDLLENMFKSYVKDLLNEGGAVKGYFSGDSVSSTEVINNDEILRLFRYYPSVDSNRILYLETVDFGVNNSMWNYVTEKSGVKKFITSGVVSLTAMITTTIDPTMTLTSIMTPSIMKLADTLGEAGQKKINTFLSDNKIEKTENGFKVDSKGELFQNYIKDSSGGNISKADDFGALAVSLTEDFHLKGYIIESSKSTGEISSLKKLEGSKDYENILNAIVATKEDKENGFIKLNESIKSLKEPSVNAKGLLQRETFLLNKKIFDAEKRVLGDVWVVDADFLNSFLHPDLGGKIKGNLVLKYSDDTIIKDKRSGEKINVRVIEILDKAKIDGININTDLNYTEEGFSAKWQPDSLGVLYIDKKLGVVSRAILDFRTASSSQLPKTSLTNGFTSVGNAKLKINYNCYARKTSE